MKITELAQKLNELIKSGQGDDDIQALSRASNELMPIDSVASTVNDETNAPINVLMVP